MKRKTIIILIRTLLIISFALILWGRQYSIGILLSLKHSDYEKKDTSFYTFYYDREDRHKVEKLDKFTNELLQLGEEWFGSIDQFQKELRIYLIHKNDLPHPGFEGDGMYVNGNVILIRGDLEESQLLNTYAHEFAHYLTVNYGETVGLKPEELPTWWHEGVASAFAQRLAPLTLSSLSHGYNVEPLMNIKRVKNIQQDGEGYFGHTYLLMHYAVEYLLYHHNEEIISELIKETNDTKDFAKAFTNLTKMDINTYHTYFKEEWNRVIDIENMIGAGNEKDAKERLENLLNEKGDYFNEAPEVFRLLGDIYINQGRYQEALNIYEKRLIYEDIPELYRKLSEIAIHINKEKGIYFAEEALESAKRNGWNIEEYKKHLEQILTQTK